MTPTELARRNYALRQSQLNRLRPVYRDAVAAESVLHEAKGRAKEGRASLELMQNLKHVPNFFPTPKAIVQRMIEAADLSPGMSILEPSAGKGDIADAVWSWGLNENKLGAEMVNIRCVEKIHTLAEHLRKKPYGSLPTFRHLTKPNFRLIKTINKRQTHARNNYQNSGRIRRAPGVIC